MTKLRINKLSPVPLYLQLVQGMTEQIRLGELQPGDRIPSERELTETAQVSRTTARIAIDELVASGLVYREQGRGTFVAKPRMRNLMGFVSFTEDIIARGMKPRTTVLRQQKIKASAKIASALRIEAGESVLNLVRIRLADDEPIAVQHSYLPSKLVPGLENYDLTDKSLFNILRTEYGIYPAWTEAEVEASAASSELAEHFQVEEGSPVLVVRGLSYTESFEVVESVETCYRSQGFALYLGRQRFHHAGADHHE
jgi:GntR family transcriptional regulator